MLSKNRFDGLIQRLVAEIFPQCDWLLIKAQVAQESAFNPDAKSPVGAQGLMQLMPATDQAIDGDIDGFNPGGNLENGINYLREQYARLPEIPDYAERLKFALASYNCGRGYINKALELAYEFEFNTPMPVGHNGAKPGNWQRWDYAKEKLKSPLCKVNGRTPDWKQAIDYVSKIWALYQKNKPEARKV